MKRKFLILSLTVALSIGMLTGCADKQTDPEGSQTEEQKDVTDGGGDSSTAENSYSAQKRYDEKYSTCVLMGNELVKLKQSINAYYDYVDYTEEFRLIDGKEYAGLQEKVAGVNKQVLDRCLEAAAWQEGDEFTDLDRLILGYGEQIRTLSDTFDSIHTDAGYGDNDYEKAILWHKAVWENGETIFNISMEYAGLVKEMSLKQALEDEALLAQQGFLIQYNSSRALTIAQQILDLTVETGIWSDSHLVYDFTQIDALYEELAAVVQGYDTAIADPAQLQKESLTGYPFNQLLTNLRTSVERLSDSHKHGAPRENIMADLEFVRQTYNQCVERYNSVFCE